MRHEQLRIEGYPVLFWKEYAEMSPILAVRTVRPSTIHAMKTSVERNASGGVRLVTQQPLAKTSR